jgi:hypothetical protein
LRLHVEVDLLRLGRPQHKSQKNKARVPQWIYTCLDMTLEEHRTYLWPLARALLSNPQSQRGHWSLPNKPPLITIAFQNVNPDSPLPKGTRIQAGCYKVEHWSLPSMIATCGDLSRQSKARERAVTFPDYTEFGPSMTSSGFTQYGTVCITLCRLGRASRSRGAALRSVA